MDILFWMAFAGVFYAYFGYPLVLAAWRRLRPRSVRTDPEHRPAVSVILPVHNEEHQVGDRLQNLRSLDYPTPALEIFVVSDGSTDRTNAIVEEVARQDPRIHLIILPERGGKGNAIRNGLAAARHDLIVFIDAGIELETDSLKAIVAPFADPDIGCVSGEDRIPEGGGEGLYGRYELLLRRLESDVGSIVGASGSFYAQRAALCPSFDEGLAPDLLSVLHAVEHGYRAITEPAAQGTMTALKSHSKEFRRKVRTLIRGMTTVQRYRHLLNPWRSGAFAPILFSHKVMRWSVPLFLLVMVLASVALMQHPVYAILLLSQLGFYGIGIAVLLGAPFLDRLLPARIAAYFVNVNAAIAVAWIRYLRGQRLEIWSPTRR